MLSTVSPVMVGAEAASPQPTIPLSASMRTSTLSARLISTPAMKTGFFMGKLTAIGSMCLIFMASLTFCALRARPMRPENRRDGRRRWARPRRCVAACRRPAGARILRESMRGFPDVVDAEAEVMDAAFRIAFEEFGDRRIRPRRLYQLDLGGAKLDIGETHALLGVDHARSDAKPVFVVELPRRRFEIRHGDRDMAQSGDHEQAPK